VVVPPRSPRFIFLLYIINSLQ